MILTVCMLMSLIVPTVAVAGSQAPLMYSFFDGNGRTIKVRTFGDGGTYNEPNFSSSDPALTIAEGTNNWTFAGRSLSGATGSTDGSRVNINGSVLTVYFDESTASSSTNGDWIALKLLNVPAGSYEMTFAGDGANNTGTADVYILTASEYSSVNNVYTTLMQSNAATVRPAVNAAMNTLLAQKQPIGVFNSKTAQVQTLGNYTCSATGDYVVVFRCSAGQTGKCRLSLKSLTMTPQAGQLSPEQIAVDNVVALINAIGTVTLESETAINAARTAYDALDDGLKAQVSNIDVLNASETRLAELKQAEEPIHYLFKNGNGKTVKIRTWNDGGANYTEPDMTSLNLTMAEGSGSWSFAGRSLSGAAGGADGSRVNITGDLLTVYFDEDQAASSTKGDWIALKLINISAGTYQFAFTGTGANDTGTTDVFVLTASEYNEVYTAYTSLTEENAATVRPTVNTAMQSLLSTKQPLGVFDSRTADTQILGNFTCETDGDYVVVFRCSAGQTGKCRLVLSGLTLAPQTTQGNPDQEAADNVIALIDAIGTVTLNSETAIVAARTAYDALTNDQKTLVTNVNILTAAEAALSQLKQEAPQKNSFKYTFTNAKTIKVRTDGDGGTYVEPNFSGLVIDNEYDTWTFVGRNLSGKTGSADGSRVNISQTVMTVYFAESTAASSTNGDWIAVKLTNIPVGYYKMTFTGDGAKNTGLADVFVMPASEYSSIYTAYTSLDATVVNDGMKTLLNGKQKLGVFDSTKAEAQNLGVYNCESDGDYVIVFRCSSNQSGNCRLSLSALDMEYVSKADANKEIIDSVIAKINAIGTVTLDSGAAIESARAAYNALDTDLKALVTNHSILTAAEAAYAKLKQEDPMKDTLIYAFTNPKTIKIRTEGDGGTYIEPNFSGLSFGKGFNSWTFVGRSLSGKTGSADGTRVNINQDSMVVYFTETAAASSTNGDWVAVKLTDVPAGAYRMTFTNYVASGTGKTNVFVMPAQAYNAVGEGYLVLDKEKTNSAMVALLKDIEANKIVNAKKLGVFDSAMNPASGQNLGTYSCQETGDYVLVFQCAANQSGNCRLSLTQLVMQLITPEEINQELIAAVIAKIDAIGEVELSSEEMIRSARQAYDTLDAMLKEQITNYNKLIAAEALLATMKKEAATTYNFTNPNTIKVRTSGDDGTYIEPYFTGLKINAGYGIWTFVGRSLSGKTGTADGTRVNINKQAMVAFFTEGDASSSSGGDWIAVKIQNVAADMYKMMFTNVSGTANGLSDVYIMPAAAYSDVYSYYMKQDKANIDKSMTELLSAIDAGEIEYAKKLEKQFDSGAEPAYAQRLDVLTIEQSGDYVLVFRCAANQSGDCRLSLTRLNLVSTTTEQIEQEEISDVEKRIDEIGEVYLPESALAFARADYERIKSMWEIDTATYAEFGQAILFLIEKIQNVSIYAERNINIARLAYEELSDAQKAKVVNYDVLEAAEAKLSEIRQKLADEKDAIDKEVANSVQTMINGIGKVSSISYTQIKKSRVAYNWLTLEQKAMITNYSTLREAEEAYIALTGNFETVVEAVDLMSSVITNFNVGNNDFVATSVVKGHDYLYVPHNGVMYVYDLDTFSKVDEEKIGMSETDGIFIDSKGIVWVYGQAAFMYRYDPFTGMGKKTAKLYVNGSTNKTHVYYPIEVDGKLYVGSYNMGELAVYNPDTNAFTNLGQLVEGGVKLTSIAHKDGFLYASVHAANAYQDPHVLVKYEIATKQVVATLDLRAGGYMENSPYLTQSVIVGDVLLGATSKREKILAVDINTMKPVDVGSELGVVHGFSQVITDSSGNEKVYYYVRGASSTMELYEYNSRTRTSAPAAGFDGCDGQFNTRGSSFVTIDAEGLSGESMLVGMKSDGTIALYNMETKKLVQLEGLTGQDGSAINIIDFRGGPEGSNEIYFGGFMSNQAAVYDIKTNTVIKQYPAYSEQLETSIWFDDTWYVTGYGACSISEMDYDTGEYKVLFALNEKDKLNFVQERIHTVAAGGNKVFGATVPHKNILGGFIVWYDYEKEATFVAVEADKVLYQPDSDRSVWRDVKTDEVVTFNTEDGGANDFKGVIENQIVNGLYYQNGYLYGTTYIAGGSGSLPAEGSNAELFIYDVENMQLVSRQQINDSIDGLVTPVELISIFAPDPEIEGKFWGVVASTLFTATVNSDNNGFEVQEVLSYGKEFYKGYISKYKTGQMYFTDGYIIVNFKNTDDETESAIENLRIINMEDPSYNYSLSSESMRGYVLGEDGNIYFERNDGVSVLYTSDIIKAIKDNKIASDAVIKLINAIGSNITLESEVAIKAARAAFDGLMLVQKSLVKNESVLLAAEEVLQGLQEAHRAHIQKVTIIIAVSAGIVLVSASAVLGIVLHNKKKRSKKARM